MVLLRDFCLSPEITSAGLGEIVGFTGFSRTAKIQRICPVQRVTRNNRTGFGINNFRTLEVYTGQRGIWIVDPGERSVAVLVPVLYSKIQLPVSYHICQPLVINFFPFARG